MFINHVINILAGKVKYFKLLLRELLCLFI